MLLILLAIMLAQNPAPQQNAKTQHHKTPASQFKTNDTPPNTDIPSESSSSPYIYYNSADENQENEKQGQHWWKRPSVTDWLIVILTCAYVGINFGILFTIKRQADIARDSLRAFKDQTISNGDQFSQQLRVMNGQMLAMKQSAAQAHRQVDALFGVAAAARDSAIAAETNLRILIEIERARVDVRMTGFGGPIYYFSIKNHGRTPAKILKHETKWTFAANSQIPEVEYTVTHTRLLSPDEDWNFLVVNIEKDISPEIMERVNKGETGLSLLGTLHYEDVADQPHTTTFCYTWRVAQS
jgi:hypothetical protein